MTLNKNPLTAKRGLKRNGKSYALLAISSLLLTQMTSCSNFSQKKLQVNIFQPLILKLNKGVTIPTADGAYTPQTDEIWQSNDRFIRLEKQLMQK